MSGNTIILQWEVDGNTCERTFDDPVKAQRLLGQLQQQGISVTVVRN